MTEIVIQRIIDSLRQRKWLRHTLCWLLGLFIIIASNLERDLVVVCTSSLMIVVGMMIVYYSNHSLIEYVYKRHSNVQTYIYLLLSLVILGCLIFLGESAITHVNNIVVSMYDDNIYTSPMDLNIPEETKSFFEDESHSQDHFRLTQTIQTLVFFSGSYLASVFTFMINKDNIERHEKEELMRMKSEMELKFLRTQINPHFLFNALNNIYSMIFTGDKNASDAVLVLSDMLRYVVDNSKEQYITLKDEIQYLDNFVAFQKFSFEQNININFVKNVQSNCVYVSPMLMQPFIENCFKYSGLGNSKDAFVEIEITTDNGSLCFKARNSRNLQAIKQRTLRKREGVGIMNVIKRLDLVYPDMYKLDINENDTEHIVSMVVPLMSKSSDGVMSPMNVKTGAV